MSRATPETPRSASVTADGSQFTEGVLEIGEPLFRGLTQLRLRMQLLKKAQALPEPAMNGVGVLSCAAVEALVEAPPRERKGLLDLGVQGYCLPRARPSRP